MVETDPNGDRKNYEMKKDEIISILSAVCDPELPVLTISDLGILRDVDIQNEKIVIRITPTYSGCPAMDTIRQDIRSELAKFGFKNIEIQECLAPPWTTAWMTESGKAKLLAYGIAVPSARGCSNGEDQPEFCPHCRSGNIELISRFGSTACKALYKCLDCREPFDYFKCH